MSDIVVVRSKTLGTSYEPRYVVVDNETGEIVDDAQGYGYKSPQKAHAAYAYKNRDKSKDAERKKKEEVIKQWIKGHKGFIRDMEQYAFEIAKGSWGPDDKFDAKFVRKMLKEAGYEVDFTAGELLKVWKNWKL